MFQPNVTALWFAAGGTDKFGQNSYPAQGVSVPCAVTKLDPQIKKTPIRSVESASRGEADELVEVATLLFPTSVSVKPLDKVIAFGYTLRCIRATPMISVAGEIDFYECAFEAI
jgi:hypothetical protein